LVISLLAAFPAAAVSTFFAKARASTRTSCWRDVRPTAARMEKLESIVYNFGEQQIEEGTRRNGETLAARLTRVPATCESAFAARYGDVQNTKHLIMLQFAISVP
jgi:hypothetical protein